MTNNDIAKGAVQEVANLINSWGNATTFITDKVAFNMRELIKTCRKNYYGIFDTPNDPNTGRKKKWIPLTESVVESVVKNIDLDTKDINFISKNPDAIDLTHIIRSKVHNELDITNFGEGLDKLERDLAINGTAVWRTVETYDEFYNRKVVKAYDVDLLNFYIDPTAKSIAEADQVIERMLMTPKELKRMNWDDISVEGMKNLHPTDKDMNKSEEGVNKVAVYRALGLFPKKYLTGDPNDTEDEMMEIIVSGLEGDPKVHLIKKWNGVADYEEAWYQRVPNRWYGRGVCEKLLILQSWLNIVVNIRINRHYVTQLGLFKIRKGAGVTPKMVTRLAANGAIMVNSMDDIDQFTVQEASRSSYDDEDRIYSWAQRVTSAFETVTGESLPSSTTATVGAIQQSSGQSQFTLIKEGVGNFLERWTRRQMLPRLANKCTAGEIVRITGSPDDIQAYKMAVAKRRAANKLDTGMAYEELVQKELENVSDYAVIDKPEKIRWSDYDVQVFVTNEKLDKGVMMQNVIAAMNVAPEYKDQLMKELFDLMGKSVKAPQGGVVPEQMSAIPGQSAPDLVTQSNTNGQRNPGNII